MKTLLKFVLGFTSIFAAAGLNGQDYYLPGIAPSLSFSEVLNHKMDLNILGTTKIRRPPVHPEKESEDYLIREIFAQALVSYNLNSRWQIGAGYGFQRNNPFHADWRNEHRAVQQLMLAIPIKNLKFYQRLRFEERWFRYPSRQDESGTRARYLAGIISRLKGGRLYWHLNNEIYCIPSGNRYSFIAENWLYTGVGFQVNHIGHLETGIGLNSMVRNGNRDITNLILVQVSWSYIHPSQMMRSMHPVLHSRNF